MNNFDGLLEKIAQCSMKKLAVAVAQDDAVIEAVRAAKDRKIADAIKDATERGAYSCQVIVDEQCTKDSKRKYREILEELGYSVEVERHLETDDWGHGYYNISLKIRWD